MSIILKIKPFSFSLLKPLQTSQGVIQKKQGWLLHLENESGNCGWGEVSPFDPLELRICEYILAQLSSTPSRQELEDGINIWPKALAFGIGAALAELDCLIGHKTNQGWLKAPTSAVLLSSNESLIDEIKTTLLELKSKNDPLTFKWKVGVASNLQEENLLAQVLSVLPLNSRLRLDANGGWNRQEANTWAGFFFNEPRLEWLEQPLAAEDLEGLKELSEKVPVALDESLSCTPSLRESWQGWQIRRPLLEGDPRILLNELQNGLGYRVLSTAFETGIGLRWINHLAALQQKGATPTAPGLAPGWSPNSPLFSQEPESVWDAA